MGLEHLETVAAPADVEDGQEVSNHGEDHELGTLALDGLVFTFVNYEGDDYDTIHERYYYSPIVYAAIHFAIR